MLWFPNQKILIEHTFDKKRYKGKYTINSNAHWSLWEKYIVRSEDNMGSHLSNLCLSARLHIWVLIFEVSENSTQCLPVKMLWQIVLYESLYTTLLSCKHLSYLAAFISFKVAFNPSRLSWYNLQLYHKLALKD